MRHGRLAKISCRRRNAALEHVEHVEAARFAGGWNNTGYPLLYTGPTIMRLSGRWKPSMPKSAWLAPSCI
jgi:hypothetical protein